MGAPNYDYDSIDQLDLWAEDLCKKAALLVEHVKQGNVAAAADDHEAIQDLSQKLRPLIKSLRKTPGAGAG